MRDGLPSHSSTTQSLKPATGLRPLINTFQGHSLGLGRCGGAHALGDDADLLHAGALGCVDHGDDLAVPQRPGAHDEHRLVARSSKIVRSRSSSSEDADVLVVDGDPAVGRVAQHDLTDGRRLFLIRGVSAGRLMSRPRCDSGSAAMKMTRSTSSTSIIGVTFMSHDASSVLPL
jgi:hypothetical protein